MQRGRPTLVAILFSSHSIAVQAAPDGVEGGSTSDVSQPTLVAILFSWHSIVEQAAPEGAEGGDASASGHANDGHLPLCV